MDLFFIEYRDPIFGLIVLFTTLLLIAIFSYLWGVFSKKDENNSIEKFVKKFESGSGLSQKHRQMLLEFDVDTNSLGFLASIFAKNGDFNKAISVYLVALQKVIEKQERKFLLTSLGKIYLRAGFLERASEVFLEAIRLSPRNDEALRYLVVVYEKLRMYEKSLEALDALMEQGVFTKAEIAYTKALMAIQNSSGIEEKLSKILSLSKDFKLLQRMALELCIKHKKSLDNFSDFPPLSQCIDIIFSLNKAVNLQDRDFKALFVAKGLIKDDVKILDFNLNLLKAANERNLGATLNFSYVCTQCKNHYPLFFYRCPNCARLGSAEILTTITKEKFENDMPF